MKKKLEKNLRFRAGTISNLKTYHGQSKNGMSEYVC